MSLQEVTLELLLSDGSNYASWFAYFLNAFRSVDPDLVHIFDNSILPSKISRKPSKKELRCLTLNYHACNILADTLTRDVYYVVMTSDSDMFIDAPFSSICSTNILKEEEK
jgi:hypothetical protein